MEDFWKLKRCGQGPTKSMWCLSPAVQLSITKFSVSDARRDKAQQKRRALHVPDSLSPERDEATDAGDGGRRMWGAGHGEDSNRHART
jgi:hypothetical protein